MRRWSASSPPPTIIKPLLSGQCIESVLAQSYANWEQIIINDGSTDKTREVVSRYVDPRNQYVYQENQSNDG